MAVEVLQIMRLKASVDEAQTYELEDLREAVVSEAARL